LNFKLSSVSEFQSKARQIRIDIIKSLAEAGSGHSGATLGLADIFTALYFNILNHDPQQPDWEERDRLILSIGHAAPVLYASLAHSGYFSVKELLTLRKLGSRLQGHPGREHGLPGLELSAGSLGQGLSVAVGMALAAKMDNKSWRVFSIHGDGELQEGSVWEAAMSAGHYKLDNLVAVIDRNNLQIDGIVTNVMNIEPLADKWKSFGWNVIEIDGHDFQQILKAFRSQTSDFRPQTSGLPTVIIANTIMGKGVRSIEDNNLWHGKAPTKEQALQFISELN
jgi:transketolase